MDSASTLSLLCGLFCFVNVYATTSDKDCTATMSANPPDPKSGCCGVDATVGSKIYSKGGANVFIDQHPWLALIEYVKDGKIQTPCGGSLISGRFVMTAAFCVGGHALTIGTPTNIRLGEYDTSHDGPDCEEAIGGGVDCTEGEVRIAIEKIIVHPEFEAKESKRNDIALIKMKELAPFTDFIRPVCLPTKEVGSEFINFIVAGWGTSYGPSPVKFHVKLPLVTQDKCQSTYSSGRRNLTLWKGQICAGGQKGKDSCKGDGGMPLMYKHNEMHEVVGIVSFGLFPCGQEGAPSVYTSVYEYIPWIKSIISEK